MSRSMTSPVLLITTVFFILYSSNIAKADIDYYCLSSCVNNGGNTSICMPKCTYGMQGESIETSDHKIMLNQHNQFPAMSSPDNPTVIDTKIKNKNPTVNYFCLSKCLQGKLQYKFCEEQCAAKPK